MLRHRGKHYKENLFLIAMLIILLAMIFISVTVGRYSVPLKQLPDVFREYMTGKVTVDNRAAVSVLFVIRIPRIFLTVLVGAALSVSGAVYQGLFRNPMVSPDILGVSQGAGTGAALALILGLSSGLVHLTAFAFAIVSVLTVILIARFTGNPGNRILIMVLSGTVVSSIFSSATSLLKYVADTDEQLPAITFWLMGSFAKSGNAKTVLFMLAAFSIGIVPLFALRTSLNALSFGEEEAASLGVNVPQVRGTVIFCATLLTASSVCIAGMIGWVGLIIPHMVRLIVGPNYRWLLPGSMLMGAVFMLVVDNVARVIIPGELPIGIITSLIGAPLFIYLLFRSTKTTQDS